MKLVGGLQRWSALAEPHRTHRPRHFKQAWRPEMGRLQGESVLQPGNHHLDLAGTVPADKAPAQQQVGRGPTSLVAVGSGRGCLA